MDNALTRLLKRVFGLVKDRLRLILGLVILLIIGATYFRLFKAAFFVAALTLASALSKAYHRVFKSSLGIDLVFFSTAMVSLAYRNMLFSFITGYVGLIAADTIGTRFSYTSVITLLGLTAVILASQILAGLPALLALILLMVLFEAVAGALYGLMGSSMDRILVFLSSHAVFNLFLIFSFGLDLLNVMR